MGVKKSRAFYPAIHRFKNICFCTEKFFGIILLSANSFSELNQIGGQCSRRIHQPRIANPAIKSVQVLRQNV